MRRKSSSFCASVTPCTPVTQTYPLRRFAHASRTASVATRKSIALIATPRTLNFGISICRETALHRRRRRLRGRWLHPLAVLLDEVLQPLDGFVLRDVELHGLLADVEIDLPRGAADVAEIGVRHFAGAVHDAAHDRDLHAFEMHGGGFDARRRFLEIEERATA